jgi:putative ABC transport system permease protein
MILLRLISWPYFRKHALRTILTTAGIILGVAVFIGMHTANQSVVFAFRHTIDSIAGKAELQVTAGEAGFDEDVLERVQDAATVAVAVPIVEAVVDSNVAGQGSLLILGVDMTGDQKLRDYNLESAEEAVVEDPLVFLAQPDSIIVTKEYADRAHLAVGGRLALGTMEGMRFFTVRGILKSSGRASALGGNLTSWTSTPHRKCSAEGAGSIASISRSNRDGRSRSAARSCASGWAPAFRSTRRRGADSSSKPCSARIR